jgi:hypothetical protein
MRLFARSIKDIEDEFADTLGGVASNWSSVRYRRAINRAIRDLSTKVLVPGIYTMPSNWDEDDYDYVLPSWIDASTMIPQQRRLVPVDYGLPVDIDNAYTWVDIPGWEVERGTDGLEYLRFQFSPVDEQGRIKFWSPNSPAPLSDPDLGGSMLTADDEVVLTGTVIGMEQTGFVQIENEFIQYAGVTYTGGATQLTNCIRGACGTSASAHNTPLTVYFAFATDETNIFSALQYQALVYLHEMYLNESAARNQRHHQEMIAYYQTQADKLLRYYMPSVSPRFVLDRRGEAL